MQNGTYRTEMIAFNNGIRKLSCKNGIITNGLFHQYDSALTRVKRQDDLITKNNIQQICAMLMTAMASYFFKFCANLYAATERCFNRKMAEQKLHLESLPCIAGENKHYYLQLIA